MNQPKKPKERRWLTQLNDLNDNCLLAVLDWLSPEQLFKMLRVNKRFHQLAEEKMRSKIQAVALKKSDGFFSDCSHFDTINRNQVLVMGSKFIQLLNNEEKLAKNIFFGVLTRCHSVKSVDVRHCELTNGLIRKLFKNRPEIECLKVGDSAVEEYIWYEVFEQIGKQIVHFAKGRDANRPIVSEARLLRMVAEECPNIKQVELETHSPMTSDFLAAIKMLPKSCWIKLECGRFVEDIFENVDELSIATLDWSQLGRQVHRLSSLKFSDIFFRGENRFDGVVFTGLKKLDFSNYLNIAIDLLIASQFPVLEELSFDASIYIYESAYIRLFQRMTSVKKLNIFCYGYLDFSKFPGPAIHRLKKLEIITFKVKFVPSEREQINFFKLIKQYVWEINPLKKLELEMLIDGGLGDNKWQPTFRGRIEALKVVQSRVEIKFRE